MKLHVCVCLQYVPTATSSGKLTVFSPSIKQAENLKCREIKDVGCELVKNSNKSPFTVVNVIAEKG